MKWTGGCQCGYIRYEFLADPIVVYICHCRSCQKQASSAFGISVWIAAKDFVLSSGVLSYWATKADSGNEKICTFCFQCGSRIFHSAPQGDDVYSVKGGSLDEMELLEPSAHIWMKSALPWAKILFEGQLEYETQPLCFDEIIKLYRSESAKNSQ